MFADFHAEDECVTDNFTVRWIQVIRIWAKMPKLGISSELESLRSAESLNLSVVSEDIANLKSNLFYFSPTLIERYLERFDAELASYVLSESVVCLGRKGFIQQTVYRITYNLLAPVAQRVVKGDFVAPIKKQIT